MATKEFDILFEELTAEMVEIAHDLVNFQKENIDRIFVIASIEQGLYAYNFFFKVNGRIAVSTSVNKVLGTDKFDLSLDRVRDLLSEGTETVRRLGEAFRNDKREVPTLVKMWYEPQTGKFSCKIDYELHYSDSDTRVFGDVLNEWIAEESKS